MEDEDGWNHDRYIVPDIVLRQCQGLFYMLKRVESQRHDLKIRSIYFMLIYRSTHFYHEEEIKMKKYVCDPCGWIYDPEVGDPDGGIAPGTAFEDIPDDWVCPLCGVGKDMFSEVEE